MGTRGLFGFYYKGYYYVVYNHCDSYPSGLGAQIVEEIKQAIKDGSFKDWYSLIEKIRIVNGTEPTTLDIQNLKKYTNLNVSTQSENDWYCLLRECQGSLKAVLESGYLMNHVNNKGNPIFQEYGYLVNLDTNQFDYYVKDSKKQSYDFNNLPNWE